MDRFRQAKIMSVQGISYKVKFHDGSYTDNLDPSNVLVISFITLIIIRVNFAFVSMLLFNYILFSGSQSWLGGSAMRCKSKSKTQWWQNWRRCFLWQKWSQILQSRESFFYISNWSMNITHPAFALLNTIILLFQVVFGDKSQATVMHTAVRKLQDANSSEMSNHKVIIVSNFFSISLIDFLSHGSLFTDCYNDFFYREHRLSLNCKTELSQLPRSLCSEPSRPKNKSSLTTTTPMIVHNWKVQPMARRMALVATASPRQVACVDIQAWLRIVTFWVLQKLQPKNHQLQIRNPLQAHFSQAALKPRGRLLHQLRSWTGVQKFLQSMILVFSHRLAL